ncbi:formylglycine-generating enzyme family protein [Zoogloea sp. 1C4]|uniref:formylglycine-generating enzyme family protein n=1 Tax=Zoogloea sp. 1C4 TaxID=2570190 RepID=UPI001290E8BC|nr:formylglycine-generating enzyme family protein [Zoogloea sp. 1C4]
MKPRRPQPQPAPRSTLGRADLLRLLDTLGPTATADVAGLLGYEPVKPPEPPEPPKQPPPKPPKPPLPQGQRRPPLQATHFAVVSLESFPAPTDDDLLRTDDPAGPIIDSLDGSGEAPPASIPLSPERRLAVFLRRHLRQRQPGRALDVPKLVAQAAYMRFPRRLPRLRRPQWSRQAALVIDKSVLAQPLDSDLVELAELAYRLSRGNLTVLALTPEHEWQIRGDGIRPEWKKTDERTLTNTKHWLLAGDLAVHGQDSTRRAGWVRRLREHLAAGGSATVLAGAIDPASQRALPGRLQLVRWDHGRRLVPGRGRASEAGMGAEVERLLAALSLAVRVEPALLREIRLSLQMPLEVEMAVWNHEDVGQCELGMWIRAERAAHHRTGVRNLPLDCRQRVARIVEHHHRGLSNLIRMEERALAADLADWQADAADDDWAAAARTLAHHPHSRAAQALSSYLARLGPRAHERLWASVPHLQEAYVRARRDALRGGAPVPAGVSAAVLNRLLSDPRRGKDAVPLCLAHHEGQLMVCVDPPEQGAWPLVRSPDDTGFELSAPGQPRQWHAVDELPLPLGRLVSGAGPWTIETAWVRATVAEIPRPSWALEWECMGVTLYAYAPSPIGKPVRLAWVPPGRGDDYVWPPSPRGFNAEAEHIGERVWMGADLEFGLYIDVPFGSATQRFRWIEPGEFVMGSPEGEVGREEDEGPRHVVRVTEGFWLAETACSQAVWSSVMGSNPSNFTDDPQNPVEKVSWDDVQGFLREVEKRLPGVKADLPTEAEWEYACRAGSDTAFSWGDGITLDQANYRATESYANGPTGEYRKKTVPVKSYAPNAWGLYQMHGNVWEWCADGPRQYDGAPQVDPRGPAGDEAEALRALRGGSWIVDPRWLRAAFRGHWRRGVRDGSRGFRFSLRSTSSAERSPEASVAPEGPQGKSPAPGGGRGEGVPKGSPARRDAGPAPATMWDRVKATFGFSPKPDQSKKK